ncbi:MAG: hypothetical protein AB1469_08210 [Pseudomonadota bacterium]
MRTAFLTFILAAATFTAASAPTEFPGISGDRAYLFAAARYLNIQKDQGVFVRKAMQSLKARETKRGDFHKTVEKAQAVTNEDWNENYLKSRKLLAPPAYAAIDGGIQRSHDLREAAYTEWLGKKSTNPVTLKKANKFFDDSVEVEDQAMSDLLDALKKK